MNGWPSSDALSANGFPDATANPNIFDNPAMFSANSLAYQNAQFGQAQRAQTPQQYPYQVNPVVPSKRPRPSDDGSGVGASPRQPPGNPSLSRSQTPQQVPYAGGFPGGQAAQGLQAPPAFQHLQHGGSSNPTPSPTLSNQQYRPPTQQRVSPNPAFPQQQAMSMSPPPDPSGRVNTPQNAQFTMAGMAQPTAGMGGQMGNMNMMAGGAMAQGFNPNMAMNPNMASAAMAGGFPQPVALPPNLAVRQAQVQAQAQQQYQQRLQQQMMQNNLAARRMQAAGMNQMVPGAQHPNMATPTRPGAAASPQQQQQQQQQTAAFIHKVGVFMQQANRQFDPNPTVLGRPINLFMLFQYVLRSQGSKSITLKNQWLSLARGFGFPEPQWQQAGMEIRGVFERNLGLWETAYYQQRQADKAKMDGMQQQMGAMSGPQQPSPAKPMPQTPQQNQFQQQYMQQLQQRMQQSQMPQTPAQNNTQLPTANGFSTPTPDMDPSKQHLLNQQQKAMNRQVDASPAGQQPGFPTPSPIPGVKPEAQAGPVKTVNGISMTAAPPEKEEPPEPSTNYKPNVSRLDFWGGVAVEQTSALGEKIAMHKPVVPDIPEMGLIDLRALSMSLQSGIHAEVRYALDCLVKLSNYSTNPIIDLEQAEDLLDIMVDCAESQVELLELHAREESNGVRLRSYEQVVREAKIEINGLQNVAEAGSLEYNLDRAAERLVAITTILRNFSFLEKNQVALAGTHVVKLISNALRLLGTRIMFLRTHNNTQDFMKDLVTFLSNVSDKISLPSRDDALSILHFLLTFAPSPPPTSSKTVRFTFYDPRIHRYYPPAIDSLAKLLARDDPNKTHYKHLFIDNVPSTPAARLPPHIQYELLTRTFALAVAIIPDRTAAAYKSGARELRVAEARKAPLTQGMLAADILLSLCPAAESGLAKAWITSGDGWAPSLLRLLTVLSMANKGSGAPTAGSSAPNGVRGPPPPQHPHAQGRPPYPGAPGPHQQLLRDELGFEMVVRRGFDVIKRLCKMAREGGVGGAPADHRESDSDATKTALPNGAAPLHGDDGDDDDAANGVAAPPVQPADVSLLFGGDADAPDAWLDDDWDKAMFWRGVLGEALPKEAGIIGALLTDDADGNVIREMLALSRLDD